MPPSLNPQQHVRDAVRRRPGSVPLQHAAVALPRPRQREVHVWEFDLHRPPAHAIDLLDPTEHERALRFVFAIDQSRFIAAHGWLRQILGRYLGRAPQALQFVIGPYGKPELAEQHDEAPLCFNLSHSGDKALLAVSDGIPLGVDIEATRANLPDATLAAGVLTAAELSELAQIPAQQRTVVFFACWTRKEACMKALGLGLALDPKSLHVGLAVARQQLNQDQSADAIDLSPLQSPPGYAAALAVMGGFERVVYRRANSSGRPN